MKVHAPRMLGSLLVALLSAAACGSRMSSPDGPGSADSGSGRTDAPDAGPPPRLIGCAAPGISDVRSGAPGVLASCAADGTCPDGQVCFRISTELALCDVPARAPTGDACAPACAPGKICVAGVGGPCVPSSDYCLDAPCTSASDCGAGTVCTPTSFIAVGLSYYDPGPPSAGNGRCMPRSCQSDQDCRGGANGRCALINLATAQGCHGSLITSLAVACVYSGAAADSGACTGAWSCGGGAAHLCPNADGGVP